MDGGLHSLMVAGGLLAGQDHQCLAAHLCMGSFQKVHLPQERSREAKSPSWGCVLWCRQLGTCPWLKMGSSGAGDDFLALLRPAVLSLLLTLCLSALGVAAACGPLWWVSTGPWLACSSQDFPSLAAPPQEGPAQGLARFFSLLSWGVLQSFGRQACAGYARPASALASTPALRYFSPGDVCR